MASILRIGPFTVEEPTPAQAERYRAAMYESPPIGYYVETDGSVRYPDGSLWREGGDDGVLLRALRVAGIRIIGDNQVSSAAQTLPSVPSGWWFDFSDEARTVGRWRDPSGREYAGTLMDTPWLNAVDVVSAYRPSISDVVADVVERVGGTTQIAPVGGGGIVTAENSNQYQPARQTKNVLVPLLALGAAFLLFRKK